MWLSENGYGLAGRFKPVVLALTLVLLAGCQFRPLYGTASPSGSVQADLSSIYVKESQKRVTQLVRNRLISTMSPPGSEAPAQYRLELSTDREIRNVFVRSNTDVDRLNYKLSVDYNLYRAGTNQLVHQGSALSEVSYDRVTSEFANVRALENAQKRAARQAADDIRTDIAARIATL